MKADGAQGRRFPGVITSGYLPNNGLLFFRFYPSFWVLLSIVCERTTAAYSQAVGSEIGNCVFDALNSRNLPVFRNTSSGVHLRPA